MKKKQVILSIVVGVILVALFVPSTVAAQEVVVNTGSVGGAPGSTVQVPVNLSIPSELTNAQELGSLTVWISYDPTLLTINYSQTAYGPVMAGTAQKVFNVPTPGDARMGFTATYGMGNVFQSLNTGPEGTIITIGFDVNSSATIGDSCALEIYKIVVENETTAVSSLPTNGTFAVTGPQVVVSTISVESAPGSTVQAPVNLSIPSELTNAQELGSLTVWISYDPTLLTINYSQTAYGPVMAGTAQKVFNVPTPGDARMGFTATYGMGNVFQSLNTGPEGTIITIGFDVNSSATIGDSCALEIYKIVVENETTAVSSRPDNGTFTVSGVAAPTITSYTISNTTITPPQATSIDVEFSETVDYKIAIEKGTATIYDWTGDAKNPDPKIWNGTYETNGTQVPDGIYTVNVTGTNTTTGLSVTNTTETITVTSAVLPLTVTASQTTVYVGAAIGVVFNVTTSTGAAVGGATVELSDCGVSATGTTDATTGLVTISVNATSAGTITATANATGYTENTTTITASAVPSGYRAVVLVYNSNNIGYNFIAWSGSSATTASELCSLIRDGVTGYPGVGATVLPDGAYVCRWDTTSGEWDCHTVAMGTAQNFAIPQYGPVFVRVWEYSGTFCMPAT